MATLLGSATLSTAINVNPSRTTVHTFDTTRVTQTDYRPPINAYNKDTINDTSARLYNDAVEDYLGTDYTNTPYVSETEDFVEIVRTASSPSGHGTNTIFCHFDLLDIDPAATVNSIEVQVTVESSQSGYTTYSPYGTQDALHFGKIKCNWQDAGPNDSSKTESTPTNNGSNSYSLGDHYRIGSSDQETATFTFPTLTLGTLPTLEVVFTGVQNPGDTYPGANSLNIKIYNIRLRVNYTGRTRLTTGFQSRTHNGHPFTVNSSTNITAQGYSWSSATYPSAGYQTFIQSTDDLGFSSLIPSGATIDGTAIQYGLIDYRNNGGTYSAGTATETSNSYTTADGRDNNAIQLTHGTSSTFNLVSSDFIDDVGNTYIKYQPYTDIIDEPLTWYAEDANNSLGVTRAQAITENFGIKWQPSATGASYVSGAGTTALPSDITKPNSLDYAGISPDTVKYAINVAYNPAFISGPIPIDSSFTVSTLGNLNHGVDDSELSDFTGVVTMTTLGGFLHIGDPDDQTVVASVADVPTTVAHTSPVELSSAFAMTVVADLAIPGTSEPAFNTNMTVTGVCRWAGLPETLAPSFAIPNISSGVKLSGYTITGTIALDFADISGILIIDVPQPTRIHTVSTITHEYLIPMPGTQSNRLRYHTVPQQTRTYVIPSKLRTHEIAQQTRTINVEDL